jgi:hypothetical protein
MVPFESLKILDLHMDELASTGSVTTRNWRCGIELIAELT